MSLTLGLADRIGLNGPQVVRDLIGQHLFEAHAKEMGGFPMVWPCEDDGPARTGRAPRIGVAARTAVHQAVTERVNCRDVS